MTYKQFIKAVQKSVSERFGDGYSVSLKKVLKNNSIEFDSLMINRSNDTVVPNIYLNQYYLEFSAGKSVENIADDIVDIYSASMEKIESGECFDLRYDDSDNKIIMKLVNYERNLELLKNSPFVRVEDLAVTFNYLASDNEEGIGTVRITNENAKTLNVNRGKLLENAIRNTMRRFPADFEPILDVLVRIAEKSGNGRSEESMKAVDELKQLRSEGGASEMYVLTNNHGMYGAACILYENLPEEIYQRLGGFYILPCSVNELIIVPDNGEIEEDRLREMVTMVNSEHVLAEEVLSDRVYHYPGADFSLKEVQWGID